MAYEIGQDRPAAEEKSIGELFGDLARETSTLLKQEVTLAKNEMADKARRAGKDVGILAVGGAVAYAGFLTLIAALVLLISAMGLTPWVSALLVGLVVVAIGAGMLMKALGDLRQVDPTPHQTLETLREDKEWAREQAS